MCTITLMDESSKPGAVISPKPDKAPEKKPVENEVKPEPVPTTTTPATGWQFTSQPDDPSFDAPTGLDGVQWTASEFIAHDKGAGWYVLVGVGTVVLAAVTYFLSRDRFTPALIVIIGILFGVIGARKPRELTYVIDEQGVTIGDKFYAYSNFKSFSVVQEGGIESIWFAPLKRFMPSLSIYFAPTDEQKIIDTLSQFLPVEARTLDPIDRLMHRIGF